MGEVARTKLELVVMLFVCLFSALAAAGEDKAAAGVRAVVASTVPPPDWPGCAEDKTCLFTSADLRYFIPKSAEDTILLSVVSYVFNVTKAPHFYGPHGSYSYLAGKEASRPLGTMSMDDEDVETHHLVDLEEEQWEELFSWVDKYQEKYSLVGRLVDWNPGVTIEDFNARSGFSLKPPPPLPADRQQARSAKGNEL